MSKVVIKLFVMHNCQVCPQMEHLFQGMHKDGMIDSLEITDVGENPEKAQLYNIRSVPHYLINDVAFYGLKSQQEILQLLSKDNSAKYEEYISGELSDGQLTTVEELVQTNREALEAMLRLLHGLDTPLVVRIGISAIIETVAGTGLLNNYEGQFLKLTSHQDERVAIDGIYYLSLLATQSSLEKLVDISKTGKGMLQDQAIELLEELSSESVLH